MIIILAIIIVAVLVLFAAYSGAAGPLKITLTDDGTLAKQIIDGKKTVEGRKNSRHFEGLKKGDTILFRAGDKQLECKVVSVKEYESIPDFFEGEGVENVLPGVSLEDAIKSYETINKVDDVENIKRLSEEKNGKWFIGIKFKFVKEL